MFAVQVTRVLRPVGVLLGGSGRARVLTLRAPHVAALMKPISFAFTQAFEAVENRAVEGESC
ncbi:MAG: hypothetical protein H7Z19_21755 [Chitinophagaceae bacterium]|nr:hypothetical protein [Rubrivivax sp.]